MNQTIFLTKARTPEGKRAVRLLVESLRAFGGELRRCPIWLFDLAPQKPPCPALENLAVQLIPLVVPEPLSNYHFGDKVYACARAEELAPGGVHSLVWLDVSCLVVNPPVLYELGGRWDAAVRPVHIRNVGLREGDPLDAYWKKVYEVVGVTDSEFSVESFVDGQRLRAYFNTHAFAVNPTKGLLRRWLELFERLVCDLEFQAGACRDELHRIFLHQAVFSALVAASLRPERVRILPPSYNYPYNLHASVPAYRRARALNELVSFTYEGRPIDPASAGDIEIGEPLRSWLESGLRRSGLAGQA